MNLQSLIEMLATRTGIPSGTTLNGALTDGADVCICVANRLRRERPKAWRKQTLTLDRAADIIVEVWDEAHKKGVVDTPIRQEGD